jgi:hypothetical protein
MQGSLADCCDVSDCMYRRFTIRTLHLACSSQSTVGLTIHTKLVGYVFRFNRNQCRDGVVSCGPLDVEGLPVTTAYFDFDLASTRPLVDFPTQVEPQDNNNKAVVHCSAVVGVNTQILLISDCCSPAFPKVVGHDAEVLDALPHDVRAAVLGCADQLIGVANANTQRHSVGTLLLLGPSGSGCAAAVRAVSAMSGARLLRVSSAGVYASAPTDQRGKFTRQWGRAAIIKLVLEAAAGTQPCVLLLEDLHFLVPAEGRGGATEASEGMAEVTW